MKRALINSLEPGRVCQVVEVGEEFDVADTFSWVDCPDNTDTTYTYNTETREFIPFDMLSLPGFAENGYKVARAIAYNPIGDQLDMLYKEIMANGSISSSGDWATHITAVKQAIPKDDPAAVYQWNIDYYNSLTGNVSDT